MSGGRLLDVARCSLTKATVTLQAITTFRKILSSASRYSFGTRGRLAGQERHSRCAQGRALAVLWRMFTTLAAWQSTCRFPNYVVQPARALRRRCFGPLLPSTSAGVRPFLLAVQQPPQVDQLLKTAQSIGASRNRDWTLCLDEYDAGARGAGFSSEPLIQEKTKPTFSSA